MVIARDVISALLSHRELPERMGLHEHFWPHIRENAWTAQGMPEGADFGDHFDLDLRCVQWTDLPGPRPDLVAVIAEDEESVTRRGAWGDVTRTWKHRAGTPEHVGFTIETPEAWYGDFRDAFLAQDPLEGIDLAAIGQRLATARAEGRFATYSFMFVFEWLRRVFGDVFMLESLLLEPDLIHDFNRCVTDRLVAIHERLFAVAGKPDGIHFYEDLGYTQAAFASPDCHRELILPYHKELVGFFKAHGLPVIMHTCGDFRPHLPAIVEAGIDGIQALEAKTGMDVVDLAREWKDQLCFMGNLDVRPFESGDRAAIEGEIVAKVRGMRELRAPYIIMSDHSIPPSVDLDDYRFALEVMRREWSY